MEYITTKNFLLLQGFLFLAGMLYLRWRVPRGGLRLKFKRNRERLLNVHFNYNGHTWDAFEVLSLPAGSSVDKARSALEVAKQKTDPASHEFLETAYNAIVKSVS